ncbi:MAG: hypothetical protein UV41_C0026G0003 [Candidatus Daviesbacteria bacterium GW2011_GWA2_42_7]|uniref:Calcineurin-like phosphoesterase domain-containing protein n=1 Tax=Candidatus Daviesbacteria bacterium GW2011_GWA2_42_7 TaxID=1618425 RepID=A0A0G1DHQ5_9BACT|nr:MAG: hypothetical protein UV41_C0026G0003 [Candidatus Daviesbacteria bacterium GW2011_GWA2_42_7]
MVIFRMLLSLTMFLILGLGAYQAYKNFTGTDPLKMDPQAIILSAPTIFGFNIQDFSAKLGKNPESQSPSEDISRPGASGSPRGKAGKLLVRFALVADSHNNNENLSRVFVSSGLPYYVTAGDHDLWDARDKGHAPTERFSEVFGSAFQSFSDSNIRFIILFNSDNYEGVDALQKKWLKDILESPETKESKKVLVFLHEPLYHPSSDHMMGKVTPKLTNQASELTRIMKEGGVSEVFAGDVHNFGRYEDPKSGLKMTVVGALATERNVQKPRFTIVDVFEDGSYNISDTEI